MLNILQKISIVLLVNSLFFISCERSQNFQECDSVNYFQNKLLSNFWYSVSDSSNILITKDSLFYFVDKLSNKGETTFKLHVINNDTVLIKDFTLNNQYRTDRFSGQPKSLQIYGVPLDNGSYQKLLLGEYYIDDGKIIENWKSTIPKKHINSIKYKYKDELDEFIGDDLILSELRCQFSHSPYFENDKGFGFLLGEKFIYILKPTDHTTRGKFMFHFIREDKTFVNESFDFDNPENFITLQWDKILMNVVKIPYNSSDCDRVRIGEYTSNGNIWVQFFNITEVKGNPLLRYKNYSSLN